MDLESDFLNPYGLKDPILKLERCDKIWETLQLIRSMQDKQLEDIQDWIKREPISHKNIHGKKPPMTFIPDKTLPLNLIGEPNLSVPYIKYQPIFNNGNELLPQFQLAEKSRVNLLHCEVCSKEFCNQKSFDNHREQIHRISLPKKGQASRKDKITITPLHSEFSRKLVDNLDSEQSNKQSAPDENIDMQISVQNLSMTVDSIKCTLCNRNYKNIKKHMVDYHKIKSSAVLSKVADHNSILKKIPQVIEFELSNSLLSASSGNDEKLAPQTNGTSQDTNSPVLNKRKMTMPSIGLRKKLRSFNHQDNTSNVANSILEFKCEICGRIYANFKNLCTHRDRHKNRKKEHPGIVRIGVHEEKAEVSSTVQSQQDKDNNNINHKMLRTRSSLNKECSSSTNKLQNENLIFSSRSVDDNIKNKCSCGKWYRYKHMLVAHKFSCKFLQNDSTSKSSEIRNGSDKESGISITIKKKNNSYEIVSKEGSTVTSSDEELLQNEENIKRPEMCEETSDSSSDNSDSSEFDDQLENLVPEEFKYSDTHCILKLKLAEQDEDVEIIDDPSSIENCITTANNNGSNIPSNTTNEVPLLSVLCKKFLIQRGVLPRNNTTHKCHTCQIFLGSKEKLTKHVERHKKLLKKSCNCGLKFSSIKAFDNHIAAVHPNLNICPYCKEKYLSIAGLAEHYCVIDKGALYIETFNENYPCPNCNIVFNKVEWLDSHLKSKHLDRDLPYQCYQCLEKFPNEIARSSHSHEKHNRSSTCSFCNQKFQSVKTKQKHEAYHRGVGFPCHKCKKTYHSKKNHLYHDKTVHSDFSNQKLTCFICERNVKTKSFKKHVLKHKSVLKCELCKKVAYNFKNLERHILDHHRDKNYPRKECKVCGQKFLTKEQLDAHVMIERVEKKSSHKHS
ncbi:zinc finger and BTB domain-containing protein 41-like [Athalia rosae]|uniref:zinc finger and BTB domain-containing protein 41-like n=1 Tax=Athalia rosae TaxID=37344 RepID=UPI002033EEA7|nr:zinc finger and BTB domain-containing protein 41-like [Athalia rosae]